MGQKTMTMAKKDTGFIGKHTAVRNTMLLSADMTALYAMKQLTMAVATITFEAGHGGEGLASLGPAIFLGTAALAAFAAGRAMDRLGQVPVLAGGFGVATLGCVLTGLGASPLSVVAVVGGFVLIGASMGTVMLSRATAADMLQSGCQRKTGGREAPAP